MGFDTKARGTWCRTARLASEVTTVSTVSASRDHTTAADGAWDGLRERISIQLRPVGTPVAIGFFGLAAATLVLSSLQLEWVPVTDGRNIALALMGFAFLAQGTA